MKIFNTQLNIGKCKYVINFHDGIKKHKDGSAFFDLNILNTKKDFEARKKQLINSGYELTN